MEAECSIKHGFRYEISYEKKKKLETPYVISYRISYAVS